MTKKYRILISIFLLSVSCTFHRARPNRSCADCVEDPRPDKTEIAQSLSLSHQNTKSKTAIYTLENGGLSLAARLWLLEHANRSVDIQYYSFSNNRTGLIACDKLVSAADKGVKIRILIDDAACRMNSYEVKRLDLHDNIEIKIYNAGLKLGRLDRRLNKLEKNSARLLRRMHNKTMIFDGLVSILGGRNISDEYFDHDEKYNFRDRDILLMGKATEEAEAAFEKFWNHPFSVPYAELSRKGIKNAKRDTKTFARIHRYASDTRNFPLTMREKVKAFPEELKTDKQQDGSSWVTEASFVSDEPTKNAGRKEREGSICADSMINLIRQAKNTIDIQSPYFIIMPESEQLIKETIQRGVKIRLLTNSLASTDNYEAFNAYQRDRKKILAAGIQIYEFKPDAKVRYKLMVPEVQAPLNYKAVYGLHSKTVVIDGKITVVGSYNFDPRSANYNTECMAVIRSQPIAAHVLKYMEEEFLPDNSWEITQKFNPDPKAGIKKRINCLLRRLFPKKLL